MLKIKALLVNNEEHTFSEISHAQALDYIACSDEVTVIGGVFEQIINLDYVSIEIYRNNSGLVEFENYYERLKELEKYYLKMSSGEEIG